MLGGISTVSFSLFAETFIHASTNFTCDLSCPPCAPSFDGRYDEFDIGFFQSSVATPGSRSVSRHRDGLLSWLPRRTTSHPSGSPLPSRPLFSPAAPVPAPACANSQGSKSSRCVSCISNKAYHASQPRTISNAKCTPKDSEWVRPTKESGAAFPSILEGVRTPLRTHPFLPNPCDSPSCCYETGLKAMKRWPTASWSSAYSYPRPSLFSLISRNSTAHACTHLPRLRHSPFSADPARSRSDAHASSRGPRLPPAWPRSPAAPNRTPPVHAPLPPAPVPPPPPALSSAALAAPLDSASGRQVG